MSDYLDIFQETSCPSMEVLDHYLSQDLSSGEQQKIEAHLVDCPLCNDAIEGLSMVQDKKALKGRIKHLKQLNEQRLFTVVEKRREVLSKRQSRVRPMRIAEILVAAAASIAILIATVFVILQVRKSTPEQIAQNEVSNPEDISTLPMVPLDSNVTESLAEAILLDSIEPKADSPNLLANVVEEKKTTEAQAKSKISKPNVSKPLPPKRTHTPPPRQQSVAKDETPKVSDTQLSMADEAGASSESLAPVDTSFIADESLKNEVVNLPVEREDISLRVEEEATEDDMANNRMMLKESQSAAKRRLPISNEDKANQSQKYGEQTRYEVLNQLMNEGKSYLRQERFEEAQNRFKEVLQSDTKNAEAKLYLGISQYELGLFKEAQKLLKKIETDETFGEEATWQLVKVYTKLNKQERIKKMLEEIISLKGKYAEEAQKLLDHLNEEK